MCLFVCVYKVKLVTLIEGDRKAPFLVAPTHRCWGGRYSIPWIASLTLDPYLIMLGVKQSGIKYHFWVFGMTQRGIEPRIPRLLVNGKYIYIYIERERERARGSERERGRKRERGRQTGIDRVIRYVRGIFLKKAKYFWNFSPPNDNSTLFRIFYRKKLS